uniref:Protein FAM124A-like n=1 Tax=Phallusia mammillata TaxID=59560 RepID=A0A6F9DCC0_9ASCI|nr:protein FAM124A-like [Phallusia mammillata]
MTASNKYYFRKKTRTPVTNGGAKEMRTTSSTDSDEFTSRLDESRRVTLHVITDPGQSRELDASFHGLLQRLDPTLDVLCVSESAKPRRISIPKNGISPPHPQVPALAVVLFFDDVDNSEQRHDTNNNGRTSKRTNNFTQVRQIFSRKPWKFHHRVAITGKLMSCDSNAQDFFKYQPESVTPQSRDSGRQTPLPVAPPVSETSRSYDFFYPIWGVRKVHYGRKVLRFNLFVSNENWEDQINLYRLILRKNETKVREDFCFFPTFTSPTTAVQFALKKLPKNLKPHPLRSTIVQFKVRNVGQLVPLLPHSCEPISELRWRTRDHDSNLILLQINRHQDGAPEPGFAVEQVFSDYDSPSSNARKTHMDMTSSAMKSLHMTSSSMKSLNFTSRGKKTKCVSGTFKSFHKLDRATTSSSTSPSTSPERSDVTPKSSRVNFEYFSTSRSPNDVTRQNDGVYV